MVGWAWGKEVRCREDEDELSTDEERGFDAKAACEVEADDDDDEEGYFLEEVLLELCLAGGRAEEEEGGLKSEGVCCSVGANASIISR